MSSAVVQTGASWEGNTSFEAGCFDQSAIASFDLIADVHDLHAWLDEALSESSGLTVHLSRTSQVIVIRLVKFLHLFLLLVADTEAIPVLVVLNDLTNWEIALLELLCHDDVGLATLGKIEIVQVGLEIVA